MPERTLVADIQFALEISTQIRPGLDVVQALAQGGWAGGAQDRVPSGGAQLTGAGGDTAARGGGG
ncbi:hypothetical protein ACQWB2_26790, partial [Salmonella enterica subsp. enterica serovar Infantis]